MLAANVDKRLSIEINVRSSNSENLIALISCRSKQGDLDAAFRIN
jgi:hypothetical protein